MTLLLNILWFIFGGFVGGLLWMLGAIILAITIIGLPWSAAAFRIGVFAFAPFGSRVVDRRLYTGRDDLGTGGVGLLLNVVWFVFAGWYIALAHVAVGAAQCLTIIGIPFGFQHFKLALIALAPVGKSVVPACFSPPTKPRRGPDRLGGAGCRALAKLAIHCSLSVRRFMLRGKTSQGARIVEQIARGPMNGLRGGDAPVARGVR